METKEISNHEDIINSRDVIARIDELENELEDFEGDEDEKEDLENELKPLCALAEEAGSSPDWPYGEALIRDTYFEEYAEQLAEDVGAISSDAQWPLTYIDWTAAADALRQDYMEVEFDGVAYQIHA